MKRVLKTSFFLATSLLLTVSHAGDNFVEKQCFECGNFETALADMSQQYTQIFPTALFRGLEELVERQAAATYFFLFFEDCRCNALVAKRRLDHKTLSRCFTKAKASASFYLWLQGLATSPTARLEDLEFSDIYDLPQ